MLDASMIMMKCMANDRNVLLCYLLKYTYLCSCVINNTVWILVIIGTCQYIAFKYRKQKNNIMFRNGKGISMDILIPKCQA